MALSVRAAITRAITAVTASAAVWTLAAARAVGVFGVRRQRE
jgi:hypothetical protein